MAAFDFSVRFNPLTESPTVTVNILQLCDVKKQLDAVSIKELELHPGRFCLALSHYRTGGFCGAVSELSSFIHFDTERQSVGAVLGVSLLCVCYCRGLFSPFVQLS